MKIKKVLIANRGEIAIRIARTCREMGIGTVAIYSDLDRKSPFVHYMDEAFALGGQTSLDTYLRVDKIIDICHKSKIDAVHPGYGFLAENPEFAQTVEDEGFIFIGPPASAIKLMGNKTAARQKMIEKGIPVVPGTDSPITDPKEALKIAEKIGFPILIKASAGGGGKGMRRVENKQEFNSAVEGAQREAGSAFGDSSVYIEKYVDQPRHIEFQILADKYGNIIDLGERECSIQRRHQKIIEEAPSSLLTPDLREEMGKTAREVARTCGYQSAGTVEFLVDKNLNYYFLEMNTRLQVEHPVTELVTGLDLVREQLLIASGETLSIKDSIHQFNGHAFECRIYAEDPDNNFAPSPGIIRHICPPGGPGIREDSGVVSGNEISLFYDPMISKLCSWGEDRREAINRMRRALGEYELQGIYSTIPFLQKVFNHPRFVAGQITTNFIDEEPVLFDSPMEEMKIAALAAVILQQNDKNKKTVQSNDDNKSSRWKEIQRRRILE
jgi:acetyl-CoA carboxylase biotin carboxylase subunit